jgi:hypothetical protein
MILSSILVRVKSLRESTRAITEHSKLQSVCCTCDEIYLFFNRQNESLKTRAVKSSATT